MQNRCGLKIEGFLGQEDHQFTFGLLSSLYCWAFPEAFALQVLTAILYKTVAINTISCTSMNN